MESSLPTKSRTAGPQEMWRVVRAHLENRQQRIIGEISSYPAPRPACDADFNHLLDERARISDELNRLHAAAAAACANSRNQIEEFIASSGYLDDMEKQRIKLTITDLT